MKKCLLATASAMAAALILSSAARAEGTLGSNPYISVFGGFAASSAHSSYYDDVYDQILRNGFVVGAAIGTYVGDGLRLEQELSFISNENDATSYYETDREDYYDDYDGNTSAVYLLTNLWKEAGFGAFRPYIGGGLGVGFITNDGSYYGGENGWNDTGFGLAAQLGGGARIAVSDHVAVDVGYRLKGIVDATFTDIGREENGGSANSVYSQTVQVGASYAFGGGEAMPALGEGGNFYVSLFGGAVFPENAIWSTADVYTVEGKTGFTIGAALGTELVDGLRGELELSYLSYALDSYSSEAGYDESASGNVQTGFLLANVWKDIDLGFMTPYVGGGLGFALAQIDDGDMGGQIVSGDRGLSLAGQFGLGARFSIMDHMQLDVGYRFKSIIEAVIISDEENDFDNAELATYQHVLQAGLTYNFGEASIQPTADVPDEAHDVYVSLFGGAAWPTDTMIASDNENYIASFKTGFTLGAAVGTSINDSLRGEVELSYLASDVDRVTEEDDEAIDRGNSLGGTFLLANLWYDMNLAGFTPYFGGGVGMALMNVDIILDEKDSNEIDDSSLAFAAQLGAGVRFDVTDAVTIDAGYRFKAAMGVGTEGAEDGAEHGYGSYYANIAQAGLSYKF